MTPAGEGHRAAAGLGCLLLGNRGVGARNVRARNVRARGLRTGRHLRIGIRWQLDHAQRPGRIHSEHLVDLALDLVSYLRVLSQVALGVVAALAQAVVAIREERPGLLDDVVLDTE